MPTIYYVVVLAGSANGSPVEILNLSIAACLRLGFAIAFWVASLQLFFAAGMAVAGGLTISKAKGVIGNVWDRTTGYGPEDIRKAASGAMATLPSFISLHYHGLDSGTSESDEEVDLCVCVCTVSLRELSR